MTKKHHLIFVLFLALALLPSQNYNQLVKQKELLQNEAQAINKILQENQSDQKITLESLSLLNNQISVQEQLLESMQKEVNYLKSQQQRLESELALLVSRLEKNKKNYSKLIQNTHLIYRTYNRLVFFFSSTTFNQLLKRVRYYKQLENNRRLKYNEIKSLQESTRETNRQISEKKTSRVDLTNKKLLEIQSLEKNKKNQQKTIEFLKTKEDSLRTALLNKENEENRIKSEIIDLLEKEKNKTKNLTPEAKLISDNFAQNKSLLPWPIKEGTIVVSFGEHPHPVIPGIKIMNNGVEITTSNDQVRSVFDGEVSKVMVLPNALKVIILRHGDYFTVYSNLQEVYVNIGEKVITKQNIGSLYNSSEHSRNLLGFQIWKERIKLNPKYWLSSY
ncbi:peptidoglycan DD-metalloendopeptidase family protein [Flavobacteriales bacterium]|nr:peptidoglycan DD-metalloendopeptidase family protein [Flavobacteriales bacterium]